MSQHTVYCKSSNPPINSCLNHTHLVLLLHIFLLREQIDNLLQEKASLEKLLTDNKVNHL